MESNWLVAFMSASARRLIVSDKIRYFVNKRKTIFYTLLLVVYNLHHVEKRGRGRLLEVDLGKWFESRLGVRAFTVFRIRKIRKSFLDIVQLQLITIIQDKTLYSFAEVDVLRCSAHLLHSIAHKIAYF